MSMSTLVINIIADLCPHGMLPLAYGIAQGGPTGLVPAVALVGLFGFLSAYTMTVYAKLADETKSNSIAEVWGKLIGEKTRWVADVAVFSLCFGCCVFYSAFAGDIFGALSSAAGVTGVLGKRWVALGALSSLCLLPLCLLEDISSLQFSSVLGAAGILYTVLFHVLRNVDGSYTPKTGAIAKLLSAKAQPQWPAVKFPLWTVNKGTLVLVNMLCVAFLAHYNAINYYKELDNANESRYKKAIAGGFGASFSVFVGMMILGYRLFGTVAQPLILNNFHRTQDLLATGARFACGLAITFAYPLMFAGLKSSMFNLIDAAAASGEKAPAKGKSSKKEVAKPAGDRKDIKKAAIVAALAVITSIAFKCGEDDVSVVLGIVGSVLGCGVAYILPGVLSLTNMKQRKAAGLKNAVPDVLLSHALVILGTFFGALGVWITMTTAGEGHHH
jgi:amino acid permease